MNTETPLPNVVNGFRLTVRAGSAFTPVPVALQGRHRGSAPEDLGPARNRLPGYDSHTRGMEMAAFLGLGVVGLCLVAGAWKQAATFATHRDEIAARLSGESVFIAGNATNHALTNLTAIPSTARQHADPTRGGTRPS